MTLTARQMVMMAVTAQPVADLAGTVHERVDHARTAEEREGSIDGCEPDPLTARAQRLMDLLGRGVVRLIRQRLQDLDALTG
jgi:hypothetical protein